MRVTPGGRLYLGVGVMTGDDMGEGVVGGLVILAMVGAIVGQLPLQGVPSALFLQTQRPAQCTSHRLPEDERQPFKCVVYSTMLPMVEMYELFQLE